MDWLVLKPGTKLSFEFNNPSFVYDIIPGNLVWNFNIPAAENAKLLEFAHFIEIKNKRRLYKDWRIVIGGKEMLGTLAIQKPGTREYQCVFILNGFPAEALDKKLEEYDWGADEILGVTSDDIRDFATAQTAQTWPAVKYNFATHKNLKFYGDDGESFSGILNQWDMANQEFKINEIDTSENVTNQSQTALVPWLYLCFMIEQLFKAIGYNVSGSFLRHEEIKKLLVATNYALDRKANQGRCFVGVNNQQALETQTIGTYTIIEFDDESSGDFEDPDNCFNITTHEYDHAFGGNMQVTVALDVSFLFGNELFHLKVAIFMNGSVLVQDVLVIPGPVTSPQHYEHTFSFFKQPNQSLTIRIILFTGLQHVGETYSITGTAEFRNLSWEVLNVYDTKIHFANHVPDMTAREFLNALRKTFNLRFDFDAQKKNVNIDFCEDVFAAKAIDWTDKAAKHYESETLEPEGFKFGWDFQNEGLTDGNFIDLKGKNIIGEYNKREDLPIPGLIGDIAYINNTNKWLTVVKNEETELLVWQNLSDNFFDYLIENGGTEIIPSAAPMLMDIIMQITSGGAPFFPITHHDILAPVTSGNGSSPAYSVGINKIGLRLCIWHGIRMGQLENYPLASSYNRDYAGNIIGNLSLRWDDALYGVYVTWWKKWIAFIRSTEPVFRNFDLNFENVAAFNFKNMRTVRHVESVIRKLSADVDTDSGRIDTEMEMMKRL